MTIPSAGKAIGALWLIVGLLKMFGVLPIKYAAAEMFLAGILTALVIP